MSSGLYVAMAVIGLVGCSPGDRPEACGYRCGPSEACPANYSCHADGRCHSRSAPDIGCTLDGGPDSSPDIVSTYPAADDTEIPVTTSIRIVFDESVVGVDVQSVTLRRRSELVPISASVSYDDREHAATLTPETRLEIGATYVVTVEPYIRDANGTSFAGRSWEFTTVIDSTPPRVSSVTPLDGATEVSIEAPVIVAFSEHVYGVYSDNFTVKDPDGVSVGHFAYLSGSLVRIDGPWVPNTTYTVRLAPVIVDGASNALAGVPLTWSFTTGADTVPPRLLYRIPDMGDTNATMDAVYVRFSERMIGVSTASITLDHDGTPVQTTVMYDDQSHELSVRPVGQLESLTVYRVSLKPTLTDTAGNPIVPGVLSWTFETGELDL